MPGPGELPSQQPPRIIGREAVLAQLRGLVDQVRLPGQVLLVTGEAGMGKTVLLADAAGRARSAGIRVLSVTGRESESRLAFAGLHQLLRPVLPGVANLPARQAHALTGVLGLTAGKPGRGPQDRPQELMQPGEREFGLRFPASNGQYPHARQPGPVGGIRQEYGLAHARLTGDDQDPAGLRAWVHQPA